MQPAGSLSGNAFPDPQGPEPAAESRGTPPAGPFDFTRFYLEYRKAVLNSVHKMVRDWQKAEDIVQEAFVGLHQKLSLLLKAWEIRQSRSDRAGFCVKGP